MLLDEEPPRLNEMSSGQTAECFFLKCDECTAIRCSCFCHTRRSNFYERIEKRVKEPKPIMMDDIKPLRGRPPRRVQTE